MPTSTAVLSAVLLLGSAASEGATRAGEHIGQWSTPPRKCPSSLVTDGPLLGNGDAGAAMGGFGSSGDGNTVTQSFYLGKMDFWTQQNLPGPNRMAYFSHVAPGHITMQLGSLAGAHAGRTEFAVFSASQELLAARVNASVGGGGSSGCGVVRTSAVMAPERNLLVARLTIERACLLNLTLSTPNMYGLPIQAGYSPPAHLWLRRQNNKWVYPDATLTECAQHVVNAAALRHFVFNSASAPKVRIGALRNGTNEHSCMWLATDEAESLAMHQPRGSFITMGECGVHGTAWEFDKQQGTISSIDYPGMCVGYWVGAVWPLPSLRQAVAPVSCTNHSTDWAIRFSVTKSAGGAAMLRAVSASASLDPLSIESTSPCLAIVRPNINISLAITANIGFPNGTVLSPQSQRASNDSTPSDPGCLYGGAVCSESYQTSSIFQLQPGTEYVLRAAVETTRGRVPSQSAYDKAMELATTSIASDVESENARVWALWFNKSAVDLGPARSYLEGYWYGAQYMLRCMSKSQGEGGVIPGLLGPWSLQDPVGWSDDVTLDYNVEANYYGAASSNHPEAMDPYFATLSSLIPLGRQRASLPSWNQGGHEAHGFFGQQTEAMGCNCNNYDHCYVDGKGEPCPATFGGFDGIELPSAIGAFQELHCSHDSSMRSTAAMTAQPFIDYVDYTANRTFMASTAYPFVKEVALFYASYLKRDPVDGKFGVPFGCAQEVCSGRQSGGYHPQKDDTIDLSYAKWIFTKAVEWGRELGDNVTLLDTWHSMSLQLKAYPLTDQYAYPHSDRAPWCAESNCTGFSEAINTDVNSSAIMYANYMWPIANFAPIHPTGMVSLSSDNLTKTMARNTIWLVNNHSGWHPVNGICLAWPSAARMMDKHDPYPVGPAELLSNFETALRATMQPNFWPSMGGGGLEQVGATQAINELLLQSFDGYLSLFPGWPLNENASFTTLRAVGAFLVSSSIDTFGVVGPTTVYSEAGKTCALLSPWGDTVVPRVVESKSRQEQRISIVAGGKISFDTTAGMSYIVSKP